MDATKGNIYAILNGNKQFGYCQASCNIFFDSFLRKSD